MMVHSRTTPSRGATRGRTPQPRHRPRPHPATSTSSRRARGTRRARRRRRERPARPASSGTSPGRHADRRVQRGARVPARDAGRRVEGVLRGGAAARHRPHRHGVPGRALRRGADRAGRQRRRRWGRDHPGGGPRADRRPGAPQRHRPRPHRRRGGVPLRSLGVRLRASAGRRQGGGAQPGGTGPHRPGDHVRDVTGERPPGRGLRRGGTAPGGHLVRGGGVPRAAQRHRLHRLPRRGVPRAELGVPRRGCDLPHAAGHPGGDGPGQPPAPRRQHPRPRPGVRPDRPRRPARRPRRHLLPRARRPRPLPRLAGAAVGAAGTGRRGRARLAGPTPEPGHRRSVGRRLRAGPGADRGGAGGCPAPLGGDRRPPAGLRRTARPVPADLVPAGRAVAGRRRRVRLVRAEPTPGRPGPPVGRTWRPCPPWPGRSAGWWRWPAASTVRYR